MDQQNTDVNEDNQIIEQENPTMNKMPQDTKNKKSILDLIYFHLRLIQCGISLIGFSYGIYFAIITSNSIWTQVIGKTLLILSIFIIILSFFSTALSILCLLPPLSKFYLLFNWIFVGTSVLCMIFGFIVLSFSAEYRSFQYEVDFTQFCQNTNSSSFCNEYWTKWSRKKFIRTRTIEPYNVFSGIFSIWIITFIFYFCIFIYSLTPKSDEPDLEPLNPQ